MLDSAYGSWQQRNCVGLGLCDQDELKGSKTCEVMSCYVI